ncbi:HET-domain-containing protein [Nemania sp. FL0031]|nr:HET-domain-containing protein [Nemania sp. FL0031]
MRLLNTRTLELRDFLEGAHGPYAILSHTWGDEEITFQDLLNYHDAASSEPTDRQRSITHSIVSRDGFVKIKNCCGVALRDDLEWVWVDTCCIDKTSSAELSEAINSMFRWYERSTVCYAFLSDVSSPNDASSFRQSRWFTRGWTLQELLAPSQLRFYDLNWNSIGEMTENSRICELISSIASIPPAFLTKETPISQACVAKRMSWAARRTTTRPEDIAYCLLGIFDINMPLLYGEGAKAFIRLQKEIIRNTNDDSTLAWGGLSPHVPDAISNYLASGALATHPVEFEKLL